MCLVTSSHLPILVVQRNWENVEKLEDLVNDPALTPKFYHNLFHSWKLIMCPNSSLDISCCAEDFTAADMQ